MDILCVVKTTDSFAISKTYISFHLLFSFRMDTNGFRNENFDFLCFLLECVNVFLDFLT